MDSTSAITASPPAAPPPVAPLPPPPVARTERKKPLYYRVLEVVASLRVTCVLFVLSIMLVLFGTLAQVDLSIFGAVNIYFRSAFVWVPFTIFFPRDWEVWGGFPFPGGWLLGGLLLANLLAAHAIRFKVTWKRSGILLIHSGLIVMMLSELITGLFAIEGRLHIEEGKGSNYVQDYHHAELAITSAADEKHDNEIVVPDRFMRDGGKVTQGELPFELDVVQYMVNSNVLPYIPDDFKNSATKGVGRQWAATPKPSVEGTQSGGENVDSPSAYVRLKARDGADLGTYLVSTHTYFAVSLNPPRYASFPPQNIRVGDKVYQISLRHKRTYQPYTMHLKEGKTEYYPGTDKAKSYSSTILLVDPSRDEKREVTISMNNPLRYRGETFFQSGMSHAYVDGKPTTATILQVVRNPGWLMPYISCAMVTIGMIIHFGLHLMSFLERRSAL